MRNKIISYCLFVLVFFFTNSCFVFETCDGVRYQIKVKTELGNGMCQYRAESIGNCLIWNDQKFLEFTDDCKALGLSQIVDRDELCKKYGI